MSKTLEAMLGASIVVAVAMGAIWATNNVTGTLATMQDRITTLEESAANQESLNQKLVTVINNIAQQRSPTSPKPLSQSPPVSQPPPAQTDAE